MQSQFYRLQIEETLFSSLDSNLDPPTNESTRLRLENQTEAQANKKDSNRLWLDLSAQPQSGQIVFSPGGSEAFVFPRQEPEKVNFKTSYADHWPGANGINIYLHNLKHREKIYICEFSVEYTFT